MAANDGVLLRSLELRLLRCTLPSECAQEKPSAYRCSVEFTELHSLLNSVVSDIEAGDYVKALASSPASIALFSNVKIGFSDTASLFYTATLPERIRVFLNIDGNKDSLEVGYKALILMALGVAALLAFTQCNITGPVDYLPLMPFEELVSSNDGAGCCNWTEWEEWASKEILPIGSEFCAKFSNFQYLIIGKTLLTRTRDLLYEGRLSSMEGVRSISWWLARSLFIQQKLLDERSSSLFDLLQVLMHESLTCLGKLEEIKDYWQENEGPTTILSMLHVEKGIMDLYYGRIDSFKHHLGSAEKLSNYNYFVSGALGFRTRHQIEPKAQLRLVTLVKSGDTDAPISNPVGINDNPLRQKSSNIDEASDILVTPRFVTVAEDSTDAQTDTQNQSLVPSQLKAVHQAIVLAHCICIDKNARSDELQKWEMAPYIEAIDSQNSSPFMIQCFCNILRIRWESSRGRTKERAVLMMDNLVERVQSQPPDAAERLFYSFGVSMPLIPLLRKYTTPCPHHFIHEGTWPSLVSIGLVGEAIRIYEDLELWDDLILCYKLMDKKAAAVELIKKRLSEKPLDSRLWCSLGDVTYNDSYYEKALDVSGNRSARAFHSLARSAYNRGEYDKAKVLYESALALNSMYPNGWFALGAAALKSKDVDKALDAFTRSVQLDPDNGESWNNIACLHMIKKRNKESFIAFKEALKLKRDSWEMWENFSHVAADVGNYGQAMEAIQKVLDMTKKKRIDYMLLERIMLEVETRSSSPTDQPHLLNGDSNHSESEPMSLNSNSAQRIEASGSHFESMVDGETQRMMDTLGKILKQIIQSGGTAETWGLYARWHKLKGDLAMCAEALLKQVRSYQGADLWKDKDRFTKFARSSLELCKVYQAIASLGSSRKELFTAEMHLKSSIKQAVDFKDTEEYRDLVTCLENVQLGLKSVSSSAS